MRGLWILAALFCALVAAQWLCLMLNVETTLVDALESATKPVTDAYYVLGRWIYAVTEPYWTAFYDFVRAFWPWLWDQIVWAWNTVQEWIVHVYEWVIEPFVRNIRRAIPFLGLSIVQVTTNVVRVFVPIDTIRGWWDAIGVEWRAEYGFVLLFASALAMGLFVLFSDMVHSNFGNSLAQNHAWMRLLQSIVFQFKPYKQPPQPNLVKKISETIETPRRTTRNSTRQT